MCQYKACIITIHDVMAFNIKLGRITCDSVREELLEDKVVIVVGGDGHIKPEQFVSYKLPVFQAGMNVLQVVHLLFANSHAQNSLPRSRAACLGNAAPRQRAQ